MSEDSGWVREVDTSVSIEDRIFTQFYLEGKAKSVENKILSLTKDSM